MTKEVNHLTSNIYNINEAKVRSCSTDNSNKVLKYNPIIFNLYWLKRIPKHLLLYGDRTS